MRRGEGLIGKLRRNRWRAGTWECRTMGRKYTHKKGLDLMYISV
jgi:hypothetical protein